MNTPATLMDRSCPVVAIARRLAFAAASSLLVAATASAEVVYSQTFDPFVVSGNAVERNFNNWAALTSQAGWGVYFGSDGTAALNPVVQAGGSIWSQTSTTGHVFLGTGLDLDFSAPTTIQLDSAQSGTTDRFRFLIQTDDGLWYISNTAFQPGQYGSISAAIDASAATSTLLFSSSASDWSLFSLSSQGITITALTADLSSTTVTGIGWWSYTTSGSIVARFDNLIVTSLIPEPSTCAALLGAAGLGAAMVLRRRRF